MNNFLRNCAIGLLYVTAFIPLYVDNSLFFPFITGKAFAFRILVEIIFALWLVLMLRDRKYAPRFSWLSATITAFAVIVLIADLSGVNPIRSLWSNFERMEGWVTIAHLWAYFIAMTCLFGGGEEGRRKWHTFFKVSIFAAFIVGIYGVVQLAGGAQIHQGSNRIDASLGNAAYMAVYMLGHAFLAFYLTLVDWARARKGTAWLFFILGLFFSFLLYETATRGTILGLVGGLAVALGIYALFGKGESKKLRAWGGGVIVLFIVLGVALVAAKNTSFVKNSTTLNRLATISWSESQGQARSYIWPMAFKGAFQNPKTAIIGWGQENFNYIFNANYNPKMWSQEQWFDRAHSVFIDWLVAGGLLALALYVSLFVLGLMAIWKSELTFGEKCLMTGFYVGYGIHNIFVFDNIASYMLFFTVLGFSHTLVAKKPLSWFEVSSKQTENMIVVRDYIYVPAVVVVFLATFYFINLRPILANKSLISAMIACSGNNTPKAELFDKALAYNQYVANQEIREQVLACSSNVFGSGLSQDVKGSFYMLATKQVQAQIAATPNDARAYLLGGVFFDNIGDYKTAQPMLEKALQLSPGKQSIMFELAQNYLSTGREKEAYALLKQAYEEDPTDSNAEIGYISSLIISGDEAKVKEITKDHPEILSDERLANAFIRIKEYDRVIDIYKKLVEKNPDNPQYYGSLAAAYYESKDTASALEVLEKMKEKFPLAKAQIDAAIAQVKSGK